MRLARYFGTSAAVWLRMQIQYDLEVAEEAIGGRIVQEGRGAVKPICMNAAAGWPKILG